MLKRIPVFLSLAIILAACSAGPPPEPPAPPPFDPVGTYDFVASNPSIYNGRPASATEEMGKVLVEHAVEDLAAVLKKIQETELTVLEEMRDRLEALTAAPRDTVE